MPGKRGSAEPMVTPEPWNARLLTSSAYIPPSPEWEMSSNIRPDRYGAVSLRVPLRVQMCRLTPLLLDEDISKCPSGCWS